MAKLDASINISVEKIYADAFKQMAKELADNHGLYITDIEFDWGCDYMLNGNARYLNKLRVVTESK